MTKDFLFFSYSWVKNANIIFKKFEENGYTCDYVYENNLTTFKPINDYKAIVLYLHEPHQLKIINNYINTFYKYSYLIQHDDTDEEHVQKWSDKKPDLVIQREYTKDTNNFWGCPIVPMHFAVESIYSDTKKEYDVSFIGTMTNERRRPFVNKILDLSKTSLKHLNWYIDVAPRDTRTPDKFKEVINKSKIGLHYFGNSYDSLRIWEMASTKTAILMPKMKSLSISENYMTFNEYEVFKNDFTDLEEKIIYLLKDNNYASLAEKSFSAFNTNHNPNRCFEYYLNSIKKYINI
jgi:hypothetical protein